MKFDIRFTQIAADQVRAYRKFEQTQIFDAIENQLRHDPTTETRNRKRLSANELADWELRVQNFRVFYDVVSEDAGPFIKIKAVGHKEHNKLFVAGKEVEL